MAAMQASSFSSTLIPTKVEQDLFDICLATAALEGKGTTVRVAGGWVRDKLLGLNNDDIDLALDNMTGVEFGKSLQTYMKSTPKSSNVKTNVIKANPDQSKHLETVTAHFCGFEIDITNLRSETYSDGSRIPEIKIGTPEEDALRRDLTINSLFYNLNLKIVEDFTGRGIADLENKICSTPLDPRVTFIDDPLRILRTVRFATRFRFNIDPAIITSCHDEDIRLSLSRKVSRERLGKEMEGMLSGRNAHFLTCLKSFHEMNLLPLIFTTNLFDDIPYREEVTPERWATMLEATTCLDILLTDGPSFLGPLISTSSKRTSLLASALVPFDGVVSNKMSKNKPLAESFAVLQWSLKLKTRDCSDIAIIVGGLSRLTDLADSALQRQNDPLFRVDLGVLLRELKDLWKPCFLVAASLRLHSRTGGSVPPNIETMEEHIEAFKQLLNSIDGLKLHNVWTLLRPLVNGDELKTILGVSAGPKIGETMRAQTLWQLEHPQGTKERFLETITSTDK